MANTLSSFDLLGNLSQQGASDTSEAVLPDELENAWGDSAITDVPDAVKDYESDIQTSAKKYGVDPQLVADYMTQESGGRNGLTSSAGAKGVMQFMDATAKDMGIADVWNAKQSIDAGAKYIALLQDRYSGDREKMAAGYNWGMGNVDKSVSALGDEWKSKLPEETSNYLTSMAGRKSGGGLSEQLASQPAEGSAPSGPSGYAVPTDESLDEALNNSFASLRSNIKGNPTFGALEWEQPSSSTTTGGDAPTTTSNSRFGESIASYDLTQNIPTEEDDYGWGVGNAFKRGLLRAGQLVDLAQNDWAEFSEGEEALKKYAVSEKDQKRLEELQATGGFWKAIGYYIKNPTLALQVVAESLPMSAPTLAGGAAGAMLAGPGGAMALGGLGSASVEYLASISEAFAAGGVDTTDPEALKAAFADEELMADARERAGKRAIGVGMFDALSMGIAGRIYKPVKALAGASKKTGTVLGGTSEMLAQAAAGAGGEGAAQIFSEGEITDPVALASEAVGEVVPGIGEMAIGSLARRGTDDAPEAGTPGTTPAERDVPPPPPDGSLPPVDTASLADLEAEMDDMPGTPPPESETATTSPPPTDEPAPKQAQEETSSEAISETDVNAALKTSADKEDAADVVAPEDVTPLITPKDLAPKITKTINAVKEPKNNPVRIAWGGLMKAIATRYPELEAKAPTGKFSGTGVARYLKKLQDQVDITKDLPEFKEFLDVVTTGKTADVIQALDRLTSTVQASAPTLADAPIDSIAGQVQATYNDFMEYYTSHQRTSKAKATKGQPAIKGSKIPFARKLGDLAGAVRALLKAGYEAGVLEEAGIGPDYGKTLDMADEAASQTMSPIVKKTKTGSTTTIAPAERTLLKIAENLKELAEKVTPLLAEAERTGKQWKADAKAADIADKVDPTTGLMEETSAVTEEPAKPKKPTKAENVKKSAEKLKAKGKAKPKGPSINELRQRAKALGISAAGSKAAIAERIAQAQQGSSVQAEQVAEQKLTKAEKKSAEVKAEMDKGQAELAAAMKPEQKAEPVVVKTKKETPKEKAQGGKKQAVTRKVSEGGMSDVFKDKTQVAVEEGIAKDLSSMVDQAAQVEAAGGIETTEGGSIAYALAGYITSGSMRSKDMMGMSQVQLRSVAKAVGAKPAASKKETIRRIESAADAEVTRVEAELAAMKAEKKTATTPDIKDAEPTEVFTKEQNITGKKSQTFKDETNQKTIGAAMESLGVSLSAAKKIEGIMGVLDDAGKLELTKLAEEFRETGNMVRFAAQVEALVGQRPSPALMEAYTEFFIAIQAQEDARPVSDEENAEALYDDRPDMTEDERFIAEQTGAIAPRIDEDTTVVDEHNVPWSARLKNLFTPGPNMSPAGQARFRSDERVLSQAVGKVYEFIQSRTREVGPLGELGPKPPPLRMQELIAVMLSEMPSNHRYTHLFKLLKMTGLDIQVEIFDSQLGINPEKKGTSGEYRHGKDKNGMYDPKNSSIALAYDPEFMSATRFVGVMLHEMVHAATAVRYITEGKFRDHINALWEQAIQAYGKVDPNFPVDKILKTVEYEGNFEAATPFIIAYLKTQPDGTFTNNYGLANPFEFMSEGFTNPVFQEFLAATELSPSTRFMTGVGRTGGGRRLGTATNIFNDNFKSLFNSFISATKKTLGISMRNSVLEELLIVSAGNFDTPQRQEVAKGRFPIRGSLPSLEEEAVPDKKVRSNLVNVAADAARGRDSFIRESVQTLGQKLIDLPKSINLGFMALDQIERNYRQLFAKAATAAGQLTSPLTRYIVSKQIAMVSARAYAEAASKIFQRVQKIDGKARAEMWRIARESTLAQVWPHVSLKDKMNDHLWGKKHKTTGVRKISKKNGQAALQARKDFAALKEQSPDAAQIIIDLAQLTKKVQDHKRRTTLTLIAQTRDIKGALGDQLAAAKTSEDLQKIFKQAYDEAGNVTPDNEYPADMIADKDNDSKEVKEKKAEARKEFNNIRGVARSAEAILKNTTIRGPYFPLRRFGPIVVASSEKWNENNEPYVSFHNNKWEARRVQDKLKQEFDMDTNIARKIESTALSADAKSVVAELKSKIKDPGGESGLHSRIDTAMLEILAESTAQQSALKRHGIDGVSSDDMGRAMEEYIQVSQYTIGDIETTWTMSEAFKDMRRLQKASPDMTPEELDTIGLVVNELADQNKEDARDREMSPLQRTIGTIGFFNFLGAPSYWVLNATQTLTVTLPYLGAKWGWEGNKAYYQAGRTIAAAAKNAKSYDQFKANLPPAAQKVVQEMEDRGILQSTIAHEFGDQLSPTTLTRMIDKTGALGRATTTGLRLMEKIPETVEKYNRISTALAIYSLSGGNLTEVADGVQATQFNYDSVNRARLLKAAPKWAGGGLRALITPIMMFKTYGIGITRLLYGNAIRSVRGNTPAERSEARKMVGGLIASHTFFGGLAGGLMLGPVQVIIDVANEVFNEVGDEFDPEEALEMYLQDVANDTVAALATRGVPAALGVDMSKSINLGNLLWMGNDRVNFADAGGVETGLVTGFGPVAQYGVTSVREGMRVWNEDPRANWYDFFAAVIPLKMARGAIRGAKYEFEGVGTDTVTWMQPEKVAGWVRMIAGFRPTKIAMLTDREYNDIGRDARRSARKSQLIDKALKASSPGERAEVWKEIRAFNYSLDKRSDWINKGDVISLRSRRRTMQRKWDRERGREYR